MILLDPFSLKSIQTWYETMQINIVHFNENNEESRKIHFRTKLKFFARTCFEKEVLHKEIINMVQRFPVRLLLYISTLKFPRCNLKS